jgi:cytoskeleton protein RodZ
LPSFGEKLKLEREKRAVTLEQISQSTKIGIRMLQALEEDKFSQLPGGIFNKGFVRAYARHLGLDEDQTITDYLDASGEGPAPEPEAAMGSQIPPAEAHQQPAHRPLPWGLFATILLMVALALSFWNRSKHNNGEHSERSTPPTAVPKPATSASTGDATAAPQNTNATTAEKAAPSREISTLTKSASTSANNAVTEAAQIAPATPMPGEFTVVILARDESWISIKADGKATFEATMLPETQHAVHAQREVVIRAGNTGALDFIFNGKKLNSQGDYGEVKTLTFGASGLLPAARATPVPQ